MASSVPSYLPVERPTLVKAEHDDGAQGLSPSKASRNDLLSITDHLPTIQDQGMVGLQTDDIPKSTQRQLTCGKGKTEENSMCVLCNFFPNQIMTMTRNTDCIVACTANQLPWLIIKNFKNKIDEK